MKKYYLVNTWYKAYESEWKPQSVFTDQHPIKLVAHYNEMDGYETSLLGWQEISKEDYELAQSMDL